MYSLNLLQSTGSMSVVYSKDYWRTVSESKLKNGSFTHLLSPFSATSPKADRWRWTRTRLSLWQSGPLPSTVSNNFYRRFIRKYSNIASPLTKLTSVKTTFLWTPEADLTFQQLKDKFSSAPIYLFSLTPASSLPLRASFAHAHSSPKGCPLQSKTTMWAIGNFWQSNSLWNNGGIVGGSLHTVYRLQEPFIPPQC